MGLNIYSALDNIPSPNTKEDPKQSPFFPPTVHPEPDLAIAHEENYFPITEKLLGSLTWHGPLSVWQLWWTPQQVIVNTRTWRRHVAALHYLPLDNRVPGPGGWGHWHVDGLPGQIYLRNEWQRKETSALISAGWNDKEKSPCKQNYTPMGFSDTHAHPCSNPRNFSHWHVLARKTHLRCKHWDLFNWQEEKSFDTQCVSSFTPEVVG